MKNSVESTGKDPLFPKFQKELSIQEETKKGMEGKDIIIKKISY